MIYLAKFKVYKSEYMGNTLNYDDIEIIEAENEEAAMEKLLKARQVDSEYSFYVWIDNIELKPIIK